MNDVVVVGGGVAGSATAIHLARQGLSVELLERASFPRRKACGEGLFPRGAECLHELGVLDDVLGRARVLHSLRLEIDDVSVEAPLPFAGRPAIGVRREVLDTVLLEQARREGVHVSLGVNVVDLVTSKDGYRGVRSAEREYTARAVVLADGLRSRLRRVAALEAVTRTRRYGVTGHFKLSDEIESRIHIRVLDGHELYVTPTGPREVNVAVLAGRRRAAMLVGRLEESFRGLVEYSGVLPPGSVLLEKPLAAGPFPAQARRPWRHNVVLVGDAAGFFDGISGEGMSLALQTSEPAATAVAGFLRDGNSRHLLEYERARQRLARNSNMLARLSLFLAGHPSLGRYAVRNLSKSPATFEKLLAINAGFSDLSALRFRDLRRVLIGV